jgi:hypothetical protein
MAFNIGKMFGGGAAGSAFKGANMSGKLNMIGAALGDDPTEMSQMLQQPGAQTSPLAAPGALPAVAPHDAFRSAAMPDKFRMLGEAFGGQGQEPDLMAPPAQAGPSASDILARIMGPRPAMMQRRASPGRGFGFGFGRGGGAY